MTPATDQGVPAVDGAGPAVDGPTDSDDVVFAAKDGGPNGLTAFFVYLLLVLAATWPLPLEAATHCWGIRYDLWGNLWLMGYFYHTLKSGALAFTTSKIFHPEGFSVWAYGHFVLQVLTSPLLAFVSPSAAYAILVWGSVSGSALALYLLARDQVKNRWAAFVAGALYAFHGLTYAELAVGSVEQAATFGLPIFLLSFMRWNQHGGWGWGIATYLSIMLTATCNWFFGIALAAFTVLYVAFHMLARREHALKVNWNLIGKAVLLALLCRLSVQPFFARVVPQILARPPISLAEAQSPKGDEAQDDLPPLLSQIDGATVDHSALRQTLEDSLPLDRILPENLTMQPRLAGPGFIVVLLGVVGIVLGGRRARFWAFAFVSLTVISMGPLLKTSELSTPENVPLPYYLIYNLIPIFRVAYRPYRFQTGALLAGCVLAAFGLAAILSRIERPRARALMAVSLLAAALFTRWVLCTPERVPLLSDARLPDFYTDIANDPEDISLVEIPLHHWAFGSSNARFQYYQSVHQKGMLNNSMFINMQQLLRLRDLARRHPIVITFSEGPYARRVEPPPNAAADVQWMRDSGFRWVVVHTTFPRDTFHLTGNQEAKEMVGESFIEAMTRLFGPPRETADALLFDVRSEGFRGPAGETVLLDFPDDFERTQHPARIFAERPLVWKLPAPRAGVLPARIAFWAMGEPDSEIVRVRLTLADAQGKESEKTVTLKLPADHWTRCVITPESLKLEQFPRIERITFEAPGKDVATINIAHLQVLFRPDIDKAPDKKPADYPPDSRE